MDPTIVLKFPSLSKFSWDSRSALWTDGKRDQYEYHDYFIL